MTIKGDFAFLSLPSPHQDLPERREGVGVGFLSPWNWGGRMRVRSYYDLGWLRASGKVTRLLRVEAVMGGAGGV